MAVRGDGVALVHGDGVRVRAKARSYEFTPQIIYFLVGIALISCRVKTVVIARESLSAHQLLIFMYVCM